MPRNLDRFPDDFMFPITKDEWEELIKICDNLGDKNFSPKPPFVFTEQGVAMLSSVLNSERAIKVNIAIMRAFVKMRIILESNGSLAKKLKQLEQETKQKFAERQQQISLIFKATCPPKYLYVGGSKNL